MATLTRPHRLLLDTNHLSELARSPLAEASVAVLERLQRGEAVLVVSMFHLIELSDPAFSSVDEMRSLLSENPHVLANPFADVEDEEIACACATAAGLVRRPPRVFAADTSEWGYHPGPVGGNAVDMLDAFREVSSPRSEVIAMADWGAKASMLKDRAALVRKPELPLALAVKRHLELRRATLPSYGAGLSAEEIIAAVGGVEFFAGYNVQESLSKQRMLDPGQKSTSNDVFDELIAFYAPYCDATAVDRRTLHRARMSNLSCAERMTRDLSEIPRILDQVSAGSLGPVASA